MTPTIRPWTLKARLIAATAIGVLVVLTITGGVLSRLFLHELEQQIQTELVRYLDRVTAQVNLGPETAIGIRTERLTDPRWQQPYSGLYWQLSGPRGQPTWRSRSLWDAQITLPTMAYESTEPVLSQTEGPKGQQLMVISRTLHPLESVEDRWTLSVAIDHSDVHSATQSFNESLLLGLGTLFLLMLGLGWTQLHLGLSPFRALQAGLERLKNGESPILEGQYPAEIQPLVDDFNQTLHHQRDSALLAREQAGNLAHGVKTPLTVMHQSAQAFPDHPLASTVIEQVNQAKRQIDWHLAKSRVAAASQLVHEISPVTPLIDSLIRAMQIVHVERHLALDWHPPALNIQFLGAAQDFQEMIGNLLDNACQWATSTVLIGLRALRNNQMSITIEDDGPGLSPAEIEHVMQRGKRLDERQSGSGLGLTIAHELAITYGGRLALERSRLGGLLITLELPARCTHAAQAPQKNP